MTKTFEVTYLNRKMQFKCNTKEQAINGMMGYLFMCGCMGVDKSKFQIVEVA